MPWCPPAFVSENEMIQSGHHYLRETENLWICRDCGARTFFRDQGPNFATLRIGDHHLYESRGDFHTCMDAQVALVLHT